MVWPFPDIQGEIGKAIQDAPQNFFLGLVHAAAFVPDRLKGAVMFGERIWNGFTPEQQATIEAAIRKAIIQACEAYLASGAI